MIVLNARSHFSIGESLLDPKVIVAEYAAKGATAIALTDTMRISGIPALVEACREKGINQIVGVRLRIVPALLREKKAKNNRPYYLRLLVRNEAGYRAMLRLLSRAFDADHFYEAPRLLLSDVCEVMGSAGNDASICLLGDFYGAHSARQGRAVALALRDAGISCASEIVPVLLPHFLRMAKEAFDLWDSDGVPTVISLPAFYKDTSQAESLDMMRAIASNLKLDERSTRHAWRDWTPHDSSDTERLISTLNKGLLARYGASRKWSDLIREAESATREIADSCTFAWHKDPPSLPVMAPDEFAAVMLACKQGWIERFAKPVFGHMPTDLEPYRRRLAYELGILRKLKFEAYFLLVSEIVNWSKSNGIRVGPGRGSVGGSLVAYLMGITDVDPIRFNLLFERFINPDRIDLPDADLDFMGTRREEIIAWVNAKFGETHVAGVSNYTTMQAAGALRDVCRMMGVAENALAFSKLVPKEHGQSAKLNEALAEVPELGKFAEEHPKVVVHAQNIEGRMRAYGRHAAGIVIAGVPLEERAVVETRDGQRVVNWDKRLVEDFGLVKIDVLGLSTLDMLDLTLKLIRRSHGVTLDLKDIPLDDPDVLAAFARGETGGVFQFESPGMRKLLRDLALIAPLTFEDLTAATALYRPGPMDSGLMEQFVKVKQGVVMPSYPHPSMEEALRDTYGVMVYQEEVMAVARDFAGFTLVESDHLRKAMGKKDKDKMAKFRSKFIDGALLTHGVKSDFAAEIFDQIEKFAGYGFNKSHASAYTLISYVCMWLKVKYPAEFFSGVLSFVDEGRRPTILGDMGRLGIKLYPPDINASSDVFEPIHTHALAAPLTAIKMVSAKAYAAIVRAREDGKGKFTSIADFEARIEKRACNSRVRDNLDKVGAFASVEPSQDPSDHHTRRRDQMELMPGLVTDAVVIDRPLQLDGVTIDRLTQIVRDWRACEACELTGLCHPKPFVKREARLMLVLDGPNYKEEAADVMGRGGYTEALDQALEAAGLTRNEVYITSLIKSPKNKDWPSKTLAECPQWLNREIELLKPPVIVTLGSLSARHFVANFKGGMAEHAGKVIYDKNRDANIVVGINPASVYFDSSKQAVLDEIISKAAALLPA